MYKADKSLVKHYTRQILFREVLNSWGKFSTKKEVLTLCNTNFELELALKNKFKQMININCLEFDSGIYKKALLSKPINITLSNKDIFEYNKFAKNISNLDFVWMDLCNSFSDEVITKIIEFISRTKFNKDAIFALTLNKRRGSIKNSVVNSYYSRYKQKGIVTHIGNFFKNKIVEVKKMEYTCFDISSRGSAMVVYIFKLGKQL